MDYIKRQIITEDGSITYRIDDLKENYHSLYGAVSESYFVYLNEGLNYYGKVYKYVHIKGNYMFVIFENGGKQYKARKDDFFKLEKFECKKNDIIKFDSILLFSDANNQTIIGSPYVKDVQLHAKVIDIIKDKKVLIFKKKRRHNYRRKLGHRQNIVLVKITAIISKNSSIKSSTDVAKKETKLKNSSEKVQPKE